MHRVLAGVKFMDLAMGEGYRMRDIWVTLRVGDRRDVSTARETVLYMATCFNGSFHTPESCKHS
jgi:hypothetical protein